MVLPSDVNDGDPNHNLHHEEVHEAVNALNAAFDAAVAEGFVGTKQAWLEAIDNATSSAVRHDGTPAVGDWLKVKSVDPLVVEKAAAPSGGGGSDITGHPAVFGPGYVSPSAVSVESYPQYIAETAPSWANISNRDPLTSGRLALAGIWLPAGRLITSIGFLSGSTAAASPTHQWFGLFNDVREALAFTADDTTTPWDSGTLKVLNLTSPYTTTYSGLHFLGICVEASPPPSLRSVVNPTGANGQAFNANSNLTTPPGLPFSTSSSASLSALPIARVL